MPNSKNLIERRRTRKSPNSFFGDFHESLDKLNHNRVSWWWPFVIFAIIGAIYLFGYVCDQSLPKLITIQESMENPNVFCGECSRNILKRLTSLGPKLVGQTANEVDAPRIIEEEISEIIKYASPMQSIKFQRQKGNGSYFLEFKPPFVNVYNNIQNVIALVEGSEGDHSVLVNCHYDTVPFSPGGADAGITCASMLEIIRILSQSSIRLKHNIVFLFNGAEESVLQGSHMFLRHEWARKCRIVINLDSAGAGGRFVLFQAGPNHPWLSKYYAQNIPHPHTQVLGEELFQSGVLPSDTDFRIFRDLGNMPGLDLAFWQGGYTYHTSYDSEKLIPAGSFQNLGDNVLALVQSLGNAEELKNMEEHSEGKVVLYDYLGWFLIRYSTTTNVVLNMIAILMGVTSIMVFIGKPSRWRHIRELIKRIFTILVGMFGAIVTTVMIGLLIDRFAPLAMPWYSNPLLFVPLHWCPCLAAYILITVSLEKKWSKDFKMAASSCTQMNMIAAQTPWMFVLFYVTALGTRSSAVLFPMVLSSAIANLLIHTTSLKRTANKWIWVYLTIHIPALAYNVYLIVLTYTFFISIFGRSGPVNGDLVMSCLSSLFVLVIFSFALPLINMVKRPSRSVFVLGLITIVTLSLLGYIGHPYSVKPNDPRPQRYQILHTHRLYKDQYQRITRNENGFVIYNLDRNSPFTLPIDQTVVESLSDYCVSELYCGIPMLTARTIKGAPTNSWISAEPPYLNTDTELTLHDGYPKCNSKSLTCQLSLTLKGPNRLTFAFAPRQGVSIKGWSFEADIKPTTMWNERPTYLIHIASGSMEYESNVELEFDVSPDQLAGYPIGDFVLSGHYLQSSRTKQFQEFLDRFPDWTHVISWPSAHRGYVF